MIYCLYVTWFRLHCFSPATDSRACVISEENTIYDSSWLRSNPNSWWGWKVIFSFRPQISNLCCYRESNRDTQRVFAYLHGVNKFVFDVSCLQCSTHGVKLSVNVSNFSVTGAYLLWVLYAVIISRCCVTVWCTYDHLVVRMPETVSLRQQSPVRVYH
jgi:hypothetical protein